MDSSSDKEEIIKIKNTNDKIDEVKVPLKINKNAKPLTFEEDEYLRYLIKKYNFNCKK
jgi:hypothetical protein